MFLLKKNQKYFQYKEKNNTGLIFKVNDILLDVESYQGGLGIKRFYKDKYGYHGSLDFSYSSSSNSIVIELGNTIEKHLAEGRVENSKNNIGKYIRM